jgi:hypothetical protein
MLVAASISPGKTVCPARSIWTTPAGMVTFAPTAAIRPSRVSTVPRSITRPGAVTIRTLVSA